ncbi:hypothetical protein F5878DRAFT_663832 [Lentinula raphanica]|uniref:Uncharacterized protein n=1 Tax=Lentinula raphanica TaxID=153919 RepID=A0AA38UB67_9AGAR|nr:hypothetical protein F5878DRAFT_663832 [Lentinula raphanica]
MSRFIVSFSTEETEAALAYYSSHATQLPPLVSGFFQTLLHQFYNESHSENVPRDTSFCSAPTDSRSTTNLQMKTTNASHATTINSIQNPRLSQTIRPYLLTPSPSPPRMLPEDGRFKRMTTSQSDFSQTASTMNQIQRGGFSLPTSAPSTPRILQDTNSVQLGVEETRLPFFNSVETTVDSGNTGRKDPPSSSPTASPFPSTFLQDSESQMTTTLPKDFPPTPAITWRGFALPKPSPPLPETRPPSPSIGSVSGDSILDTNNTVQKEGIAGQRSRLRILSEKGLGDSEHMDVQNSRKRKRPTVTENEDRNDFIEEHNLEQDDLADDEEEEEEDDDENDGDYFEGNIGETNGADKADKADEDEEADEDEDEEADEEAGVGPAEGGAEGEEIAPEMGRTLHGDVQVEAAYAGPVGTGAGTATGSNSNNSFVYSPDRASPSQEVQQESTLLLLALSSSSDSLDWAEEFVKAIDGEPWTKSDALTTESITNLAHRCSRSKNMDTFATFCRMLNELMFAAKVNSIIHAQQRAFPSRTPSIKGILNNLKQEGFRESDLSIWMSTGTRWARIAGAASIYSLILIAVKRLSYRWGREISSATLVEVVWHTGGPGSAGFRVGSSMRVGSAQYQGTRHPSGTPDTQKAANSAYRHNTVNYSIYYVQIQ